MLDDHGFEIYEENDFPLAYLLTLRTYATWLHGDDRQSVDRNGNNIYGRPDLLRKKGSFCISIIRFQFLSLNLPSRTHV